MQRKPLKRIAHGNPWVAGLAALGISSLVSMARAEENAPAGTTSTNQPPEAVAAPPPGLLLTALGGAGVAAPLTNAGI